jgi:pantoate--beta-alanine ligase
MKVFSDLVSWQDYRNALNGTDPGRSLGFVPTMGALHAGHLSLVRQSQQENASTVVSIFVNPTQFNQAQDLAHYPRQDEQDLAILRDARVDAVLMPGYAALYPDDYRYRVAETGLSQQFCGAHRPGHFDGVLSVLMKLFHLVRPATAYFGEKDYQQLQLVRGMCEAFFLPVEIRACPVVREADGLAMSSRNRRLDAHQRQQAAGLYRALRQGKNPQQVQDLLEQAGFTVDYVADFQGRRLAAASLGAVRLIDNVPLQAASHG